MSLCPTAPLYRQREFHQSALWRILVDHGEDFLKTYDSRYEESHGPLPPPSAKVMDKLLRCGDPRYGLTLFHCPECKIHMAVPFSCKTRVCPSCVNRRAECLSHSLAEKLPEGEYRHLVVTLPKKMGLRKRFQLDTRLHRQIGRLIHRVIGRWMSKQVGCHRNRREERERARPGIIMAVQSFGSGLKTHVHYHILVTDGVYFADGSYWPLGFWDQASLLSELRHSILKSLVARKCLRAESAKILESWPLDRSGFSAFVGSPINQPADRPRLERVLHYIFRPSLPLKHLSYRETTGEVRYTPPRAIGKVWSHASDFLADWVQHIPRARQHVVTYAGWFANALGKLNPKKDNETNTVEELAEKPTGKWVKWRTLILRCWAVDPELCPRCHKEMKRARALLQQHELQRLLKNLGIGLYPTRPRSPPPPALDDQDLAQESLFSEGPEGVPAFLFCVKRKL